MCGICGIFSIDGEPVPDLVGAMDAAMVHRGPDDEGSYRGGRAALGMRRLSIIGVANGHQPIFDEERWLALVLNGEIYNYRELRIELLGRGHRFATDSDAEVIVHLYQEVADRCVDRLRGMFAFALHDRERERLLVVRDRPGKKPLYYARAGGLLIFASEIKAILASGLVTPELDPAGLRSYLAHGFVLGEGTLFRGVRKLPAGCSLVASAEGVEVRRYWDLPAPVDEGAPDLETAAARIRELLEEAVRRRLMSEVPLGAFLSGGVDSSAVVTLMRRHLDRPVRTFSVGFADARYDELRHARSVAEHLGTRHHALVLRGCSPALLRRINHFHDEPAGDPAAVPTFCLSHFARRRITVALTGEGGDEIFAGYPHHRHCRRLGELEARIPGLRAAARAAGGVASLLGGAVPARLAKGAWLAGMPPAERLRGWTAAFTDAELHRLLTPEARAMSPISTVAEPLAELHRRVANRDPLARLLYVDGHTGLADQLLMKVDKMGMAASLEARCPLLDQELVEYAATLPTAMKQSPEGSKRVFRRALRGLVDDQILDRPKQGFDVPLDTWLLRDLGPLVERALLDPGAPVARHLEPAAVRSLWHGFRRRRDGRPALQLWRLLNLAVWHELHWPSGLLDDEDEATDPMAELFMEEPPREGELREDDGDAA